MMAKNLLLALLAAMAACMPQNPHISPNKAVLPAQFGNVTDTASSLAALTYRQLIAEPALRLLIDSALARNLDLKAAAQRIEVARAQVLLTRGARLPFASAGPVAGIRRFGLYTMDGAGNATTDIENGKAVPVNLPDMLLGLQAGWEADIWGRLKRRNHASIARLAATEMGRHLLKTLLIVDVASNYYDLQALDNQIGSIDRTIALQQNALDLSRILKVAGQVTELGVSQFEAQLAGLKAERQQAVQARIEVENRINFLLARYARPVLRDSLSLDTVIGNKTALGSPMDLLANRPDVQAAELELAATGFEVEAARRAFLPSLSILGGVGLQAYRPALLLPVPDALAYSLVGSLLTPLVNKSALRATFKAATAAQLEALYAYQARLIEAHNEVVTLSAAIQNLTQTINQRIAQVRALSRSVDAANLLFRTGQATYLEVLVAQQNELAARLELTNAQRMYKQSRIQLYRALGGGWK